MTDIKMKILIALAAIALFAGYTKWVYNYSEDVTTNAIKVLHNETLKKKNEEILLLKAELATSRQEGIDANENLSQEYEEKLNEQKTNYESLISDIDSDRIRLQINLRNQRNTTEARPDISTDSQTCDNETSGGEFPKDTARFLISQAHRADNTAEQLTACQATIKLYLEIADRHNRLLRGGDNGS